LLLFGNNAKIRLVVGVTPLYHTNKNQGGKSMSTSKAGSKGLSMESLKAYIEEKHDIKVKLITNSSGETPMYAFINENIEIGEFSYIENNDGNQPFLLTDANGVSLDLESTDVASILFAEDLVDGKLDESGLENGVFFTYGEHPTLAEESYLLHQLYK
jgi:hypothetical protein